MLSMYSLLGLLKVQLMFMEWSLVTFPPSLYLQQTGLPSLGQELCQIFRQCCSVEFLNTDPFSSALVS